MAILHLEKSKGVKLQPSAMERMVLAYMEKSQKDYYDEELAEEKNFQVWYHLSSLRTGLFGWYKFGGGTQVLEIGAGFGALTGMLCDRCSFVTATERSVVRAQALAKRLKDRENLEIYAGEWTEIEFGQKFDYIIMTGILERAAGGAGERKKYAEYLEKARQLLKEGGILLCAVENRFGLKYFCGAREPHSGKAFDGINHYPGGTGGYSFSRKELQDIISDAGFSVSKFYYPLPDYKLPQLIYTDQKLPDKNLQERLIPYYTDKNSLIASESELYNEIIENEVFPFFSNSFLIECGSRDNLNRAVYVALSTDRGKEKSFATVIYENNSVEKNILFPEGEKNAEQLYQNLEDLKGRGIPVIECIKEKNSILMPYIKYPTLSDYVKKLAPYNYSRLPEILDTLYGFILRSSEGADDGENFLLKKLSSLPSGQQEEIKEIDWGPILSKAYIELIPLNCFYDEVNDKFLFFDQEFVRFNYPAKYILFRAIHYIYCFTPGIEDILPQQQLRERYGMERLWTCFMKEEALFLDEVRKHDTYRQFYRWSGADRGVISRNIAKLQSEEEKIAGYKVSDKMKKIWNVELQMLDQIDSICSKHGLKYFIIRGTLLGAVRHKGFIPWDDDLDIGMLRKDYDAFLQIANREIKEPFVIQNMWTEEDCFFGGYSRLRNSSTTGIQAREIGHRSNQGIWVDIMPFDCCVTDERKQELKEKKIKKAYELLYARVYGKDVRSFAQLPPWKWKCIRLLARMRTCQSLCRQLDKAMRMYTEEDTADIAVFSGYGNFQILRKADFENTVILDFAGRKVPAPAGYENYLFTTMGRDYMKYPPEEERKPKHKGIFDPERPYTEYVKKLTGMFDDIKGKKIILFGAGLMFDDYMKKWGTRYRPAFTVDNDENKWGRSRQGVEIREPKAILEVPPEKRRLIICSFYYTEIQKQLQEMGVQDYQVYVQKLEWVLQAEKNEKT